MCRIFFQMQYCFYRQYMVASSEIHIFCIKIKISAELFFKWNSVFIGSIWWLPPKSSAWRASGICRRACPCVAVRTGALAWRPTSVLALTASGGSSARQRAVPYQRMQSLGVWLLLGCSLSVQIGKTSTPEEGNRWSRAALEVFRTE